MTAYEYRNPYCHKTYTNHYEYFHIVGEKIAFAREVKTDSVRIMNYDSEPKRLPTDPNNEHTGTNLTDVQRVAVHKLLDDGVGTKEIAKRLGHSKHTVIAVRRAREDANGGLNLNTWKKATAATMAAIVAKGSTRLLAEIENIPPGQLPLALAIMTDKVLALQDAPAVIVEHRLRVSHEDINKMLKGDVIDLPPSDPEEVA